MIVTNVSPAMMPRTIDSQGKLGIGCDVNGVETVPVPEANIVETAVVLEVNGVDITARLDIDEDMLAVLD